MRVVLRKMGILIPENTPCKNIIPNISLMALDLVYFVCSLYNLSDMTQTSWLVLCLNIILILRMMVLFIRKEMERRDPIKILSIYAWFVIFEVLFLFTLGIYIIIIGRSQDFWEREFKLLFLLALFFSFLEQILGRLINMYGGQ